MNRFAQFTVVFAMLMVLFGCAGGSSGGGGNNAPDPTVQFYHGVSDGSNYDFLYDEDVLTANLAFRDASAGFQDVDALIHDVLIRETGTTNEIWAETFDFQRDRDYLIAALGLENYGAEPLKRAKLTRVEVNRQVPNGNKARIIVFHGFNRAAGFLTPAIDFQNPGNNPLVALRGILYGETQVALIDATNQTLQARRAGTESVFVEDTISFGAGKIYAVFVLGVEDGVGPLAPRIEVIELASE